MDRSASTCSGRFRSSSNGPERKPSALQAARALPVPRESNNRSANVDANMVAMGGRNGSPAVVANRSALLRIVRRSRPRRKPRENA
jgi:hypothetical protein